MEIIFTTENLIILIMLICLTTGIQRMLFKHKVYERLQDSNNKILRSFFSCILCTGGYFLMIECLLLAPFYGLDVLLIPFMGIGIVDALS